MEMIKVLIYFDKNKLKPVGGPAGYLYNLEEELKKEQIDYIEFLNDSKVKNFSKVKNLYKKMPKFVQNNKFVQKIKKDRYVYKLVKDITSDCERKSSIDLNEYDIIHFHSTLDMYKVKDSLDNYKGIVLLTSHSPEALHLELIDTIDEKNKKIYEEEIKKFVKMDEYAFDRADYIHFPTKDSEECYYNTWEEYKSIKERNKNKYLYLPTGINEVKINCEKEKYRKKYNIPDDAFVISYVGRHNEVKGYAQLKKIAEELLKNENNIYFLIGGKEEPLKGLSNDHWIEVGWTDQPHDLINSSDMFILPNKETYFDLILLEVLSIGKVVLMTNTGGNKFFKNFAEKSLFYYDFEDINKAMEEINNIKNMNIEELEKINKKLFKENFTIEKFANGYVSMINSIIKGEENGK